MKNIIKFAFCLMGLLFCITSYAARPIHPVHPVKGSCSDLHLNKGFDVVFRITDVQKVERIIMQGRNHEIRTLWSNMSGEFAEIKDQWTQTNQSYDIWLRYQPGKSYSKKGELIASFYREDLSPQGWYQAISKEVDISHFSDKVSVFGEHIEILSCGGRTDPILRMPPPQADYCELFPGPAQTWQGNPNNLITMDKTNQINYTREHLLGFSNQIVHDYPPAFTPLEQLQGALCDGKPCDLDGVMAQKQTLDWNTSKSTKTVFNTWINDTRTATPGTYYSKNLGWTYSLTIEPTGHLTLPTGEYWVDAADIRGDLTIDGQVTLHVWDSLNIGGSVNTLSPSDNLTIFAYYSDKDCPRPEHYPKGPPQVSVDYAANINVSGEFNGRIYSHGPVTLSNQTTLIGAVTACQLQLSNTAKIVGNSECFNPKKDVLDITPSQAFGLTCERMPITFSVRQEDGKLNRDYEGALIAKVTSSSPEKSCWALTDKAAQCTSGELSVTLSGGQRTLWLESKKVGNITIEGAINDLSDSAGPYRFAPYGFRVNGGNPAKMVAGQSKTMLIEAVADSGKGCEVIEDYGKPTGEAKKLDFQSLSYVRPATGNVNVELNGKALSSTGTGSVTKSLTFRNGKAELPVVYKDAGEITFSLVDNDWQPKECDSSILDCEDFERDWKGLAGKAVIYSRPYTFAMCGIRSDSGVTNFSGTAGTGNAFAKAGEAFSVTFKPIIWSSQLESPQSDKSGDKNNDVTTTGSKWCGVATTPNYYTVDDVITAPMALSHKLATPADGEQGQLQGSGTYRFANTQQASNGLTLDNLSWSEVGSLWLQADADYLGMTVDQGVGSLGRFYPYHFALLSSYLLDAVADKFTYMDQAFSARFKVEAQNKSGGATLNYGDFSPELQETLDLVAADVNAPAMEKNELTPRLDKSGLYSGWDKATLEVSNHAVGFKRDVTKASPKTTTPDGPYGVAVGLIVDREPSDNCHDRGCTDFAIQDLDVRSGAGKQSVTAKALAGNIDARYGRLKLEDVNTQFDKAVNIPLRAEYWDSDLNVFVVNTDDDLSDFNGANNCKQMIWPTSSEEAAKSKSLTQGTGNVESGESYLLEATPNRSDYFREQVRFWQRLTANQPVKKKTVDSAINCFGLHSNQPWLTYNWRGIGDEDPSAVVTFGVYRGNDRVIYRGEKGMNQLLH